MGKEGLTYFHPQLNRFEELSIPNPFACDGICFHEWVQGPRPTVLC